LRGEKISLRLPLWVSLFREHFIKTGIFDRGLGKALSDMIKY